jgi:hypothetical protein
VGGGGVSGVHLDSEVTRVDAEEEVEEGLSGVSGDAEGEVGEGLSGVSGRRHFSEIVAIVCPCQRAFVRFVCWGEGCGGKREES